MDEEDSNNEDTFDYDQFLLAEQVRKYYYHGLYPLGILEIWSLLRADCYNLSGRDSLGNPPIVYASKSGSIVLLRLLLYYRADVNTLSKLRETALIVACRNKRMRFIRLLLGRGAQTDMVDRSGYSALRWAVIHEHVEMVKLLLRYNASVTKDCYTSGSALDIAKRGTSELHAVILKELEKKLVSEREALMLELEQQKKQDAIIEIDEHRKKRQADKDAENKAILEAKAASTANNTKTKRSRRPKPQQKILAIDSLNMGRRSSDASVGTRAPTPPVEQAAWKSLEDGYTCDWMKVGTCKWDTRQHLQHTGTTVPAFETTAVEVFAPAKVTTVRELLTSDSKFQPFLSQQMPRRSSQLIIEDLE